MEQHTEKNFDGWNEEKKRLHQHGFETLPFHEREVWWCSIGVNIGDEQDGKNEFFERPVLVVKKFNRKVAWVLPMSTKPKEGVYYYHLKHGEKVFTVILSQLRLVSVKRFRRFVRKISPKQFAEIISALTSFFREYENR